MPRNSKEKAQMADRRVIRTRKASDRDILALCNDATWSPRSKEDAIRDIENNVHRYYVLEGRDEVDIRVVQGSHGKYLRTDPDKTAGNNLTQLPDC